MEFSIKTISFLIVILSTICWGRSVEADKTLNVFLGESKIAPYDVHAPGHVLANVNLLVLGQLIENTDGFEIKPGILESYFYNFEKNSYFLRLKPDLIFHNGRKATSKDLEFTLLRGFFSSDKSFFHAYLGNILGVRDIVKGDKYESGKVKGVKIIDDLTVEIRLIGQNPSLFHSLTAPYFSLVPIEELKEDYLTWKTYPVGVGNYKVMKGFDGNKTILKSFKPNAKFNSIFLFSNKVDDVSIDISLDAFSYLKKSYSILPMGVRLLEFSNKHELGRNFEFKKLIQKIISDIDGFDSDMALKTNAILPRHFWGQVKNTVKNIDIDEAEIIKKLNLNKIQVITFAGEKLSEKHLFYIEKIKNNFKKYNVEIEFIPNSEKFVSEKTSKQYPLRFYGVVADYVDPLIMYSAYRKIGHNINYSPFGKILDEYEQLYLKAEKAATFEQRLATVKKLNTFSQKNIVQVPIAEEKMVYYINEKTIRSLGKQLSPLTINFDLVELK